MNTPNGNCTTCQKPLHRKPSHWEKGYAAFCDKDCRNGQATIPMAGQKYGKLTCLDFVGKDKYNNALWKCSCECGGETVTNRRRLITGVTTSCGCIRRGKGSRSRSWKDGKSTTPTGYVIVRDEQTGKTLGFEHRLVMQKALGRPLTQTESVHHKNGIRNDNRPENLELRARYHGMGQTIDDLVSWAKEILERYDTNTSNH